MLQTMDGRIPSRYRLHRHSLQLARGPAGDEALGLGGDDGGKRLVSLGVAGADKSTVGRVEQGDEAIGGAQVDAKGLADLHAATRSGERDRVVLLCGIKRGIASANRQRGREPFSTRATVGLSA